VHLLAAYRYLQGRTMIIRWWMRVKRNGSWIKHRKPADQDQNEATQKKANSLDGTSAVRIPVGVGGT
jgi:hypothetical protein